MFKQQSILDGVGIPNLMELTTGRWGHDHQPSEQMLKMMVIRSPMTLGHKETSGDPLASNSHVHFRAARHIHWNWIGEPCYGVLSTQRVRTFANHESLGSRTHLQPNSTQI